MTSDSHRPAPRIESTAWVAPNATIIGDVTLGPRVGIWYSAVIRADTEAIAIGADTNIQDNGVLHADPGFPLDVGERVSVGHGAILHGCRIGDEVLVGMGAIIMNGAVIGSGSIVGAGALVPEGVSAPTDPSSSGRRARFGARSPTRSASASATAPRPTCNTDR